MDLRQSVGLVGLLTIAGLASACSALSSDEEEDGAQAVSGGECAPAVITLDHPGTPLCPIAKPKTADALDAALANAGIDRCELSFSAFNLTDMRYSSVDRLPWFDEIHRNAMRAPAFGRTIVDALDTAAASDRPVTGALQVAAFGLGGSVAPCVQPLLADPDQPLARAVATITRASGGSPKEDALEADAADVPRPLQEELAQIILAAAEANKAWTTLARRFTTDDLVALSLGHGVFLPSNGGAANLPDPHIHELFMKGFDQGALARAATTLALRIERANLGRFRGLRGFSFEQDTPLGRVVVRDAANDVHRPGSHVLVMVDTGGDDTYLYPAGAVDASKPGEEKHHVGLAIDLGGRDKYGYEQVPNPLDGARLPSDRDGRQTPTGPADKSNGPVSMSETPRQGAARLGFGMLFDLGKDDDTYRSLRLSQGYGLAGVGVLYDEGGNDRYEGEAGVQGASHLGIGLLLDRAGNDVYRSYVHTQGFGASRSVGILYDGAGNDRYEADNGNPADGGDPLYLSGQIPGKANDSMAQGAGLGLRSYGAPWPDVPGGLGVLRDREGNDVYGASVYAQGFGYFFGTGILADGAGNDSYDGRYYVQAAGAHYALGLFLENGGDDRYNQNIVPQATSIGVGHDRSVAWHIDLGGNDVYRAPNLSLGSGNAAGIGVLINIGGDDTYQSATNLSLGAATLSNEWYGACGKYCGATTGIFLDIGGDDTYQGPFLIELKDDMSWQNTRFAPGYGIVEQSAGVDIAKGEVNLP